MANLSDSIRLKVGWTEERAEAGLVVATLLRLEKLSDDGPQLRAQVGTVEPALPQNGGRLAHVIPVAKGVMVVNAFGRVVSTQQTFSELHSICVMSDHTTTLIGVGTF